MSNLPIKRFRIIAVRGPEGLGPLNLHYSFAFDLELDPGDPYVNESGATFVRVQDMAADYLAEGDVQQEPGRSRAFQRLRHFVAERLRGALAQPDAPRRQLLEPTVAEIEVLRLVDPLRLNEGQWTEVEAPSTARTNRVFISCGQQTGDEVALGERLVALVREKTGLDGYFAQDQQSLEGVTANIFNAIRTSAAFISVMHRRDEVRDGDYRGSVWVEQEIAVAAFMVQSLGVALPAKVFVQRGIVREGVRGFILLNPVEFESHDDVLNDLDAWWPLLKRLTQ